jgi:hypothetical protein
MAVLHRLGKLDRQHVVDGRLDKLHLGQGGHGTGLGPCILLIFLSTIDASLSGYKNREVFRRVAGEDIFDKIL